MLNQTHMERGLVYLKEAGGICAFQKELSYKKGRKGEKIF